MDQPRTGVEGRSARRIALPVVILAASAVGAVAAFFVARGMGDDEPALVGTDLGKAPAPDFALTDQRGAPVRLADLRGRVVVLTFIYTHCPDVCPLTAEDLRATDALLPADVRDRVVLLAVTVDPDRDTSAALRAFSAEHRLADNPRWHALRGDRAALAAVWAAYAIDPGAMLSMATPADASTLAHTDAIYVIDRDGRERVLLHSSLAPAALAKDLRALAG
jgi:protein SCO1/2